MMTQNQPKCIVSFPIAFDIAVFVYLSVCFTLTHTYNLQEARNLKHFNSINFQRTPHNRSVARNKNIKDKTTATTTIQTPETIK